MRTEVKDAILMGILYSLVGLALFAMWFHFGLRMEFLAAPVMLLTLLGAGYSARYRSAHSIIHQAISWAIFGAIFGACVGFVPGAVLAILYISPSSADGGAIWGMALGGWVGGILAAIFGAIESLFPRETNYVYSQDLLPDVGVLRQNVEQVFIASFGWAILGAIVAVHFGSRVGLEGAVSQLVFGSLGGAFLFLIVSLLVLFSHSAAVRIGVILVVLGSNIIWQISELGGGSVDTLVLGVLRGAFWGVFLLLPLVLLVISLALFSILLIIPLLPLMVVATVVMTAQEFTQSSINGAAQAGFRTDPNSLWTRVALNTLFPPSIVLATSLLVDEVGILPQPYPNYIVSFPVGLMLSAWIAGAVYNRLLRPVHDASRRERQRWEYVSAFPHVICRTHLCRTEKVNMALFYSDVRCRREECDSSDLEAGVREVVGVIGGRGTAIQRNGSTLYVSMWDAATNTARNADIDVLEIRTSPSMTANDYGHAVMAVYNQLVNDVSRPRGWLRRVRVAITGKPPIPAEAQHILEREFAGVERRK